LVRVSAWICLEPDGRFAERLRAQLAAGGLRECCSVRTGTIHDLRPDERFDSVLYVDVLEHIERDREELARAAEHVAPGGALVVLVPARPGLFSAFDRALGHFRRYTAESLRAVAPPALAEAKMIYLDSVGCLASLANRFILKESRPGRWQVWTWDRLMVPVSRVVDPLLGHAVGKSLLGVWRRTA
jgi:SAM-dependent methyltransferase